MANASSETARKPDRYTAEKEKPMSARTIKKVPRQPFSVRLDIEEAETLRALAEFYEKSLSEYAEELIFFALRSRAYKDRAKELLEAPKPLPVPESRPRSSAPRAPITVRMKAIDVATLKAVAERFGMIMVEFAEELITFSLHSRTYKAKINALPD